MYALALRGPWPLASQAHTPGPGGAVRSGAPKAPERHEGAGVADRNGEGGSPDGPGGFEELFEAHRADVGRLCRRLMGGGADDAVQEVFLRGQRGFASYDPARPFRRWILGVASHLCIDQLRRETREGRLFEAGDLDPSDLEAPGPSPLAQAQGAADRSRLRHALDALPSRYRVPLVLRYFEDLDYASIAEALGVTRNQVGTLLFRARRRLREAFERTPR